eukprot:Gb_30282 [translate_table: standard]
MDSELLELQRQFQVAQEAKSSVRLSERNVVELVNTLQQLELLDSDLLHTVSGKEYITQDQLRFEMEAEIKRLGRVSLIELADAIGVDLYHVERQAEHIVANNSELTLVQGEILSHVYWDSVVEEINERLQESSQISLAELAAQLHVGSELLTSILEPRLGTLVQGKLEAGQLYTPLYVARLRSMVRGAVRGIMVPTNLSSVWSCLQQLLQEMDGAAIAGSTEGIFFQTLLNGLVKEGELLGSLHSGVSWTPAVFAHAQREGVESFFSQNSYISYDVLHKLSIPQPKQYLQSKYTGGISLETVFVHPSMISMLDAATEDAIEHGGWLDCLSILPTSFGTQDGAKLLTLCPSMEKALKNTTATILADTCVVSIDFIKALFARLEKDIEDSIRAKVASSQRTSKHQTSNSDTNNNGSESTKLAKVDANEHQYDVVKGKEVGEKGPKKKKGKEVSSTNVAPQENVDESKGGKGGKNRKKQVKMKGGSSMPTVAVKSSQQKGSDKVASDEFNVPSEEWMSERLLEWFEDLEGAGAGQEGTNALARSLAAYLRPMVIDSWKEKKHAFLAAHAEERRRSLDKLQQKLDEAYLNLQLFEKALDLFDNDPSTLVVLHRHLLRTTATEIADMILLALEFDRRLQSGDSEESSQSIDSMSLSHAQRISLAKNLPGSLSTKVLEMVEALEGKRVEPFNMTLKVVTEESGLWLKKLDKKTERALLHSYRKAFASQIKDESDPVALLPKVVALLYVQVHNKALQAPGRAMAVAVSCLKNRIPETAYTTLMEYHSATVTLLTMLSAGSSNEDDCTADRILSKRELLEVRMSDLKALALTLPTGSTVATGNS